MSKLNKQELLEGVRSIIDNEFNNNVSDGIMGTDIISGLQIGEIMITETTYKVGIYLRLSREDEKLGESESISNQRNLLLNYIKFD